MYEEYLRVKCSVGRKGVMRTWRTPTDEGGGCKLHVRRSGDRKGRRGSG